MKKSSKYILYGVSTLSFVLLAVFLVLNNTLYYTNVTGVSMNPTLKNGDTIIIGTWKTPKVGDIVAFTCFEKCLPPDISEFPIPVTLVKRVSEKNGDCYSFTSDNKEHGTASDFFGELCEPDDIEIYGVYLFTE